MGFSPEIAAIRFGEGLSPVLASPGSVADLMAQLDGPDRNAAAHPIPPFSDLLPVLSNVYDMRNAYRKTGKGAERDALEEKFRRRRAEMSRSHIADHKQFLIRSMTTETPFRDRLTRFWADHFTVLGKDNLVRHAVPHYIEEAIRPNIAGSFSDMLKAVTTHPMMLLYLDQAASFGPNSPAAKGRRGLNENLAREVMELHTLGVGSGYAQKDVRELAELLTGLTANVQEGFFFRPKMAEPGAETVLGTSYGGDEPAVEDIYAALDDLATHPDTAAHLSRKLAVHFTSDTPDEAMVAAMTQAYSDSGGALTAVYQAMLDHPFAWDSFGEKVKQPVDFVSSCFRVLNVPVRSIEKLNRKQMRSYVGGPMASMGQSPFAPTGPDGWPESAEDWVTPQGLAARLQWSMAIPSAFFRSLPDPRDFVVSALGGLADERVLFAAQNAESRREGVGLILASPGFQRR